MVPAMPIESMVTLSLLYAQVFMKESLVDLASL